MKGRPIDALVYDQLFKTPKPSDCQNFAALLQRQLVPEVRLETAAFYGNLDTKEAQYPGLDYSHPPHRQRLSRFAWHRRLFRAFDTLGLTKAEIASLTKWEGTRWAKERFEKEQGIKIVDTTGQEIKPWVDPECRDEVTESQEDMNIMEMEDVEEEEDELDEDEGEEEESDLESIGVDLNERLRARAAARHESNILESIPIGTMDEQWEQWMKEITEANENDLASMPNPPPIPSSSRPQHSREARRETYTPTAVANTRQIDGHQTRAPSRTFTTTSSRAISSLINTASRRQPHDIVPARFPISITQPRQAQTPRS